MFRAITQGKVRYGVLPFENSLTGSIHQNFDLMMNHKVQIVGEWKLQVVHHLLVNKGVKLAAVKEVYSHPQALEQCQGYLRRLQSAKAVPHFDTAGAARLLAETGRRDAAAIASAQAARNYGLKILAKGIADNPQNYTRFLVLEKERAKKAPLGKGPSKTSVVFALGNTAGALYKSLSVFAIRDIDLLKIESRPIPGSPWKYLFYLDFAGHQREKACARALEHLAEITAFIRVLGSYQAAP